MKNAQITSIMIATVLLLCPPFLMASKNVGSAKELTGSVTSAMFFISDENSEWSIEEKRAMLLLVDEAENWLILQAQTYQKELYFEHHIFGWSQDITFTTIPSGTRSGFEDVTISQQITQTLHFESPHDFVNRYITDHVQALYFFKKDGASYAFAYEEGLDDQYYLEGTAIFHQFNPKTPQCASCIAHEMLHIFGAWDFYQTFQTTAKQEKLARKLYPNSIMLRTSYSFEELSMDPVTAWRIGWTEEKPKEVDKFKPVPYR